MSAGDTALQPQLTMPNIQWLNDVIQTGCRQTGFTCIGTPPTKCSKSRFVQNGIAALRVRPRT